MFDGSLAKHLVMGFEEDGDNKFLTSDLLIDDEYLKAEFPNKFAEFGSPLDEHWDDLFDDMKAMATDDLVVVERVDTRAVKLLWLGEWPSAEEAAKIELVRAGQEADRIAIRAKYGERP